jgi:hypothetical protein
VFRVTKRRGHLFGSPRHSVGVGHRHCKFPRTIRTQMPAEGYRSECENRQGKIIHFRESGRGQ